MARYTSQEMRNVANRFASEEDSSRSNIIVAMLRQAADMMERANSVIKANAKSIKIRHRDADAVLETAEYILTSRRC